jgi:type II secretory pathway component GspD/PulD (secretin)
VLLGVTPQISGDGMITLSITPSLTERTGQAVSRFGDAVPILRIREADTLVRVRENETVVIAGLMGTRAKRKTDLVILLTSTIVTPARAPLASARAGASLSE